MSSKKQIDPQSTDDFVLNPFTKKLIRKDSKTYKRLVNAKLLNTEHKSIADARNDTLIIKADDAQEAKKLQSRMSKAQAGPNQIISRRNDKVIKSNRRPTQKGTIDKVSSIAVESVLENKDNIMNQDMNDDELDSYIKRMIQLKLIGHQDIIPQKTKTKTNKKKTYVSESDEEEY